MYVNIVLIFSKDKRRGLICGAKVIKMCGCGSSLEEGEEGEEEGEEEEHKELAIHVLSWLWSIEASCTS